MKNKWCETCGLLSLLHLGLLFCHINIHTGPHYTAALHNERRARVRLPTPRSCSLPATGTRAEGPPPPAFLFLLPSGPTGKQAARIAGASCLVFFVRNYCRAFLDGRERRRCQRTPSGDNGAGVGDKQMQKLAFVDCLCAIVSGFVVRLNFITVRTEDGERYVAGIVCERFGYERIEV